MKDGLYVQLVAVKDGRVYPSKELHSLGDLLKCITSNVCNAVELVLRPRSEQDVKFPN